ncbi:MAG: TMEM175 family protein [Methanothrix sp.]|nr:TMEM175 family protein [Methanothrix sp.]
MDETDELTLGTGRLEALADGIFAFSMTLLVIGFDMPSGILETDQAIKGHLLGLAPQLMVYTLAFFVLASFWYVHQKHFIYLKGVDEGLYGATSPGSCSLP